MEPSKEAMEAAARLWRRDGNIRQFALDLDAFAAAAVKREREECAKVCDDQADADHNGECFIPNQAMRLAAEIRSRAATERKE